jgi:phosphoribosylglycinamide formyltransferase-1
LNYEVAVVTRNPLLPKDQRIEDQEQRIISVLEDFNVDWVLLAGYMKILTSDFIRKLTRDGEKNSRLINIHPSYLPQFPGLKAYERGYESTEDYHGVTVHFVNEEVDAGKIIQQEKYPKITGESFEDFCARGLKLEHEIYPKAVRQILKGDSHE